LPRRSHPPSCPLVPLSWRRRVVRAQAVVIGSFRNLTSNFAIRRGRGRGRFLAPTRLTPVAINPPYIPATLTFSFASSFSTSSIPHFFLSLCPRLPRRCHRPTPPAMAAVSSDLSSAVASDTSAAASSVAPASSAAPSSVAPSSISSAAPSSAASSAAPSSAAPSSVPSSAAPSSASASASASASQSASLSQSLSASVSASASASASSASASSASAASASQSYSTSYV
jgi:hypothetical protein